tara:strand:- start:113 stop:907 length:795 start_codon:yes stop_codon:yes gene_type:complete
MVKITVAIPTYFSSKFISNTIKPFLAHKAFNEIIITDDSESSKEYNDLYTEVKSLLENSQIDLKISKNKSNLGGFKNKYSCIEQSSNDFIYQIDSDNIPFNSSLNYLSNLNLNSIDNSILYLPSRIYLFKRFKYEYFYKRSNKVIYSKKTKLFDFETIRKAIKNNEKFVNRRNINWLLNTGNPFFYKTSYLENTKKGLNLSKNTLSADAIAMAYYWLKSGSQISISSFLSHFHKTRNESYFVSQGSTAIDSISYFKEKIINEHT